MDPGARFGPDTVVGERYRLLHERARHGETLLWQARDEVLARTVALRMLAVDGAGRDSGRPSLDAVLDAAARAGRVSDGRFARLLDVGSCRPDHEIAWVVSEWVDGPSLAAVLREGPLPPDEAADVVAQVAEALAAAHAAGAAHGALHPANVTLPGGGVVKITDLEVAAAASGTDHRARLDARALGAMLYAAVTGCWPDGAADGLPPAPTEHGRACSPRQVRAGVPRVLDEVVCRALALPGAPGPPYESPAEVARALAAVPRTPYGAAEEPAEPATAPRVPWALRWAVPAALVALVGVVGWLVGSAIGRVPGADHRVPSFSLPTASASPGSSGALVWRTPPAASSFDPGGDGTENPDEVALAFDGDVSTHWSTDTYRGRPDFGGLKSGVGLLIDLGRPVQVSEARIAMVVPGATLQLRAADARGGTADAYALEGEVGSAPQSTTIRLRQPTTARYWLLWITRLPPDGGGFRASVAEVALLG